MAWKKITLTEDHLALIDNIHLETFEFDAGSTLGKYGWGICQWNLFNNSGYLLDAVAISIGKFDQYIKGTEDDPMGRHYPKELEDYMWGLYQYIWDNMEYIISLVFTYSSRGGLKPGTYKCKDNEKIWTYLGDGEQ